MSDMISAETMKAHRARWWVWAEGVKMLRRATMRGFWGYDVTCSCGWETRTGGATRNYVSNELWFHRWSAQDDADSAKEKDLSGKAHP